MGKMNWKALIISIAISLGVGIISSLLSMGGMQQYQDMYQPPLAPPGWLFPVVWTILYILMGIAAYLIYEMPESEEAIFFKLGDKESKVPAGKTVIEYALEELRTPDGERMLAKNIFLLVRGSEKICFIGKNGAGKTTLLRKWRMNCLQEPIFMRNICRKIMRSYWIFP